MIQVILTRKCIYSCEHCMWDCSLMGSHMADKVIDKTMDMIGLAGAVNIVGGEPLMHPKFDAFMDRVSKTAKSLRLVTNGYWAGASFLVERIFLRTASRLGDAFFIRVSNDRWHTRNVPLREVLSAAQALRDKGVNISAESMDDATVYPLGRALSGRAWEHLTSLGIDRQPAECTKQPYTPLDAISVDVNGAVSPCFHQQAVCADVLRDSPAQVIEKAKEFIKSVVCANPTNLSCARCGRITDKNIKEGGGSYHGSADRTAA